MSHLCWNFNKSLAILHTPNLDCIIYHKTVKISQKSLIFKKLAFPILELSILKSPYKVESLNCVRLFETPWTVAYRAPPSMGFSRQDYWSGLPFPSPGDLPNPGIEPGSPSLQADALPSEPPGNPTLYPWCHLERPTWPPQIHVHLEPQNVTLLVKSTPLVFTNQGHF